MLLDAAFIIFIMSITNTMGCESYLMVWNKYNIEDWELTVNI